MTIDRIRYKITRAKKHIDEFEAALSSFHATKPYAVEVKEDLARRQRIYFVSKADALPDNLAAIAADIIQNLRSPLDHIATQLVIDACGGKRPERKVYFPISRSGAHYPQNRDRNMNGVRQEVIDATDAIEPYKDGKGHALWQLNALNNLDKHELLIGTGVLTGIDISVNFKQAMMDTEVPADWPYTAKDLQDLASLLPPTYLLESHPTALKVGAELYCEPLDDKAVENRPFTFDVCLNAPTIVPTEAALKTLQRLMRVVEESVEEMAKLFP